MKRKFLTKRWNDKHKKYIQELLQAKRNAHINSGNNNIGHVFKDFFSELDDLMAKHKEQ